MTFVIFKVCAIGASIAYATGEGAEEVVEKIDIRKSQMPQLLFQIMSSLVMNLMRIS